MAMEQTTSFSIFPPSNLTCLITLSKVSVARTTVEDTTRAPNYTNENSGLCTLQSCVGCQWKLRGQSLWKAVYATALLHPLHLQSAFLPTQLKHKSTRRCEKYVCKLGPNARISSPAQGQHKQTLPRGADFTSAPCTSATAAW